MSRESYPAHWWGPVSEEGKPEWEILPQAALPGEVILSKRNELGCLSNFAPTPFEFHGKRYASVEGWWQMQFYPESALVGPAGAIEDPRASYPGLVWAYTREQVGQLTGHEAYFAGEKGFRNMEAMGINWVTFEGRRMDYWNQEKGEHYKLVVEAMWAKLRQHEQVKRVLLSTGDLILRADHFEPKDAPPSWGYYNIWMEIRAALRNETKFPTYRPLVTKPALARGGSGSGTRGPSARGDVSARV
jgi:predicted NAD-dependent protein-ADP-ribosyltransferase YbiA (DUF1768 family)